MFTCEQCLKNTKKQNIYVTISVSNVQELNKIEHFKLKCMYYNFPDEGKSIADREWGRLETDTHYIRFLAI